MQKRLKIETDSSFLGQGDGSVKLLDLRELKLLACIGYETTCETTPCFTNTDTMKNL